MASITALLLSSPTFSTNRSRTHLPPLPFRAPTSLSPRSPLPPPFPTTTPKRTAIRPPSSIPTSHPTPPAQLQPEPPTSLIRRALLVASVWIAASALAQFAIGPSLAAAEAAGDSIRASGFGLKVAGALRRSGWADEAIVLALATLPIIELRGAIPVGYWMRLHPVLLTVLSVIGNMIPVPFIVLYLKKFATFLSQRSPWATRFLDILFERAREKAGPVEEFQWLGLMLFVAVPFPGTGAWTGAFVAAILDMPFWSALSANFFGVVLAGLLVNLLVNLGLKYAAAIGVILFFVSTVMWSMLRHFKKALNSE